MEVYMSLMKDLNGKQKGGLILVILLFIIVFGYGTREWRNSKKGYCFFGPNKSAPAKDTCSAEDGSCYKKSAR